MFQAPNTKYLTMSTTLDMLLKLAAHTPDWGRVIHRCAWCGRVLNDRGEWVMRPIDASAVTTDGMCAACGSRNLAQVGMRAVRRMSLAA
jgi:hypothetical protein